MSDITAHYCMLDHGHKPPHYPDCVWASVRELGRETTVARLDAILEGMKTLRRAADKLSETRGQWIHSIHAEECINILNALGYNHPPKAQGGGGHGGVSRKKANMLTTLIAKLCKWMLWRKHSQVYVIIPEIILNTLMKEAFRFDKQGGG